MTNGRTFTLAAHTTAEWGRVQAARLLGLGCSTKYALGVERDYATAVEVSQKEAS